MGFLDKLFRKDRDINEWVQEAAGVAGSVLLDVRTREEYRQGHIPGSVNVPLSELAAVDETISAKDTPLYVYCLIGGRSARAAAQLSGMGYASVIAGARAAMGLPNNEYIDPGYQWINGENLEAPENQKYLYE